MGIVVILVIVARMVKRQQLVPSLCGRWPRELDHGVLDPMRRAAFPYSRVQGLGVSLGPESS